MRKTPSILALTAAWLLAPLGAAWAQAPTVEKMLDIRPKLEDVDITVPNAEELKDCQVRDYVETGKTIGYELIDGRKQTLRRYAMGKGAKTINTWSFFKDGVEVFRQIDTDFDHKVDQYRWLGTAGLKWGLDRDQDGKIDHWYMISAEEVAHEVFLALANNDYARLKALFISAQEIQVLGIPAATAQKMLQAQQAAPAKFQAALAKPGLTGAKFLRVESAAPGCWLADDQGTPKDVIKFASRSILFETAMKQHDWFQTGEIIQVGNAWRLVDLAPDMGPGPGQPDNPELNKLISSLDVVDKKIGATPSAAPGQANAVLSGLYEERAGLCEEVVKLSTPDQKESWYKQILDSYASGVIAGSEKCKQRLVAYRQSLEMKMPGSNLAGYAKYRELWSEYTIGQVTQEVQEKYQKALAQFVKDYANADDTPDALHQLGMGAEFAGTKDKDEEALKWYRAIHQNFPKHHLAEWAKGAEKRLKLVGNPLELSGTLLNNNMPFDINQLKEKAVIVYYWSTQCKDCPADFARLKQALSTQKDVVLVCVNLNEKVADATAFIGQNPVTAYHLAQGTRDGNGLRGSLATAYGINVLPTVFVVGRDGRVVGVKLQVADLEETLKKASQ